MCKALFIIEQMKNYLRNMSPHIEKEKCNMAKTTGTEKWNHKFMW